MSKSIPTNLQPHHKNQKGPHKDAAWEGIKESSHISQQETRGKARKSKHFPSRHWGVQMENRKGPKV